MISLAVREKAEQARHILGNDLIAEVLTEIRTEALLALADIKADDTLGILKHQATAAVAFEFVTRLQAKITAAGTNDGGFTQNSDEE